MAVTSRIENIHKLTVGRRVAILALACILASPLWSQIDRGTIRGIVKDKSGAVIPDAKITITQTETNSALSLTTDAAGLYTAPNLPAAVYPVEVEKTGFGKFARQPVTVQPRTETTVDVTLELGAVSSATIGRIFKVTEKTKFDFSVDAFNPFNFVRWGAPNTTLTSAAFGTVTTTANPRTLQVNAALRF